MLKRIRKLFGVNQEASFNLLDVNYADIADTGNLINQIYSGAIDGVFIRGVLSKDEIESVKNNLGLLDEEMINKLGTHISEGYVIPKAFPVVVTENRALPNKEENLNKYFQQCQDLVENGANYFGINLFDKVEAALVKLTDVPVSLVDGMSGAGNYAFGTIRAFVPGPGNISVHCGNYFQKAFPEFYEQLSSHVEVKDQLSYTIKLQNEDAGGELTLYNLFWEDSQSKTDAAENKFIKHADGVIDIDDEKLRRVSINYEEGDMFVFSGGRIWHRVEHVKGKTTRITLGGFIGKSKIDEGYKFWA